MSLSKKRERPLILSADDDGMIQQIVKNLLSDFADVLIAKNTVEAEDIMRKHHPDLVLMDDIMPGGITGLQFLDFVREDEDLKKIPIIMVTASNKPSEVLRGLNAGAVEYVTKPFKPEQLRDVIKKRFDHHMPQIHLVIDDIDFEVELIEAFTHLQCNVTSSHPQNFDDVNLFEKECDLIIFACAQARMLANKTHEAKLAGFCPELYVVSLIEGDALDNEKGRMYYMPSVVPVYEILKKVGILLKSGSY